MRFRRTAFGLTTAAVFVAAAARAHDPIAGATWNRDVEPIVRDRCLACHGFEGPALPRLARYEDVVANAAAVKAAVMSRRMPVWSPVRGVSRFHGDPSLSPFQISVIASWVEARTPRGTTAPMTFARGSARELPAPPGRSLDLAVDAPTSPSGIDRQTIKLPSAARIGISGWRFNPGDSTIRQATFSTPRGLIWTWVPGLSGENLPQGTSVQIGHDDLTVETTRRIVDTDGSVRRPMPQPSSLRIWITSAGQRLETIPLSCGSRASVAGRLQGIRPSAPGRSRVTLIEMTAPAQRLAVFSPREYSLPQTYWLRDPIDLRRNGPLAAEGVDCVVELLVSRPRR